MPYSTYTSKSKWQKSFIQSVFKGKKSQNDTYSQIIQNNIELLEQKQTHLPAKLCKFYAPTSDNILDIQKQRIWLSHPSNFNDPFDCHVGYDIEEYEKRCLLQYLKNDIDITNRKKTEKFTVKEIDRIKCSKTVVHYLESMYHGTEEYYDVKRKITKEKSDKFQKEIDAIILDSKKDIKNKIEKIRRTNIRVSCFSELINNDNFKKNITMWSHYADNHRGFCVEYDLSSLNESTTFTIEDHKYYDDSLQKTYLDEHLVATIKAGLFPVMYTSSRVNIPFSKLMKIKINNKGNLQHNSDIDAIIYKTYIVKSSNWSYEKEWRLIIDGKISNYYDNKIPFPYIKRIYLGCKMDQQTKNTIREIGNDLNFDVIELIMDNKKFLLEEKSKYFAQDREWYKKIHNPFT